jgi:hypothetical protein
MKSSSITRLLAKAALSLAFAALPRASSALPQWPVDTVQLESAPGIGSGFGDLDGTLGLHRGIDLPRPRLQPVFAVEDGIVNHIVSRKPNNPDESGGLILITADSGATEGWLYMHVLDTENLELNQEIHAGDLIGVISSFAPGPWEHLHFGRQQSIGEEPNISNGQVPRNPLLYYEDNLPPMLPMLDPNQIKFVRDQQTNTGIFQSVNGMPVLWGDVDIWAEAHNRIAEKVTAGVYSISYEISDGPGSTGVISRRTLLRNRQMPLRFTCLDPLIGCIPKAPLIYPAGQVFPDVSYVVTNSGAAEPHISTGVSNVIENAWYTKVLSGIVDTDGGLSSPQMATTNADAKFPDGKYAASIRVGTYRDSIASTTVKHVLVDNFRPFLVKIEVGSNGEFIREWLFNGAKYIPTTLSNHSIAIGTHPVALTFSEPIVSSTLTTFPPRTGPSIS